MLVGGLVFGAADDIEIIYEFRNSIIAPFAVCNMVYFHTTTRVIFIDLVVSYSNR